jgi:glycerophosphoryl diester phosphodiesterase
VLTLVALESRRARRTVGVMLELKHAAYFEGLGLSLVEPLVERPAGARPGPPALARDR